METAQALIEAIKTGDLGRVAALIEEDPSVIKTQTGDGLPVVLLAAYYNQSHIADLLAEATPALSIFEAASVGKRERLIALLAQQPELVNAYAPDGFTPLGLAAFFGHRESVEALLDKGAQVNAASHTLRVMPLHSAVAGRHLEISKMLLAHGADVNAVQQDNITPLHEAAQNGQLEMVELVLSYGAALHAQTSGGQTALDLARLAGHPDIVDWLQGQTTN